MCLAVYLGSDKKLPEIGWDEANPGLHIKLESLQLELVKGYLRQPFIYYVGSHEGCGCGFCLEGYSKDDEDWDLRVKNYKDFASYLEINAVGPGSEIYVCWEGDQGKAPEKKIEFGIGDLKEMKFELRDLNAYLTR